MNGSLTDLNCAIGKDDTGVDPTVKVTGPQLLILVSELWYERN